MRNLLIPLILALPILGGCQAENEEIWIDVRSQAEYESGHLEEAILIPHDQIAERIAEVTDNKNATIHLYCRSGGRAGRAKTALNDLGFINVVNEGGYEDVLKQRATD